MTILRRSFSTPPSSEPTSTPRGLQKNGDQALAGGLTTKTHALVEGLGCLAPWALSGGQVRDLTQAEAILDGIATQAIITDKVYDAESLIEIITQRGACAVIPPRENRR
jgi:hypothetical protein